MPAENSDDGLCKLMMLNLSCSAAQPLGAQYWNDRLLFQRLSGPSRASARQTLEPTPWASL